MGNAMRRFGQALATTAVLMVLLLGATGHADARQKGGNSPKETFARNCEASGGTVSHIETVDVHTRSCSYLDGKNIVTVSCDFYGYHIWVCTGDIRLDSHYTP